MTRRINVRIGRVVMPNELATDRRALATSIENELGRRLRTLQASNHAGSRSAPAMGGNGDACRAQSGDAANAIATRIGKIVSKGGAR